MESFISAKDDRCVYKDHTIKWIVSGVERQKIIQSCVEKTVCTAISKQKRHICYFLRKARLLSTSAEKG